ncbi:hypothetical protein ACHAQA_000402 [Verticillium albo-atrum]
MASIGPQMPPSPSKRKRTPDDDRGDDSPPTKQARNTDEINLDDDDSSDDGFGPSAPASHGPSAPKPAVGPSLPPTAKPNTDEIDLDASDDDDYGPSMPSTASQPAPAAAKPSIGPSLPPKRTIGPSLPPPSSSTAASRPPANDPGSDSDSDEDDYAPALPGSTAAQAQLDRQSRAAALAALEPAAAPAAPQRDDWMLAPPPAAGGYNERDPSKLKNRRFASNKPHSSAPSGGGPAEISSIWTETPEQKRKRLEDAVLGRAAPAGSDLEHQKQQGKARPSREEERARRTAENLEAVRGKSLYDTHMSARKEGERRKDEEEEDDPSARAFDREKDMALGGRINSTQRRELLGKAKDFGGRFQKGSYL